MNRRDFLGAVGLGLLGAACAHRPATAKRGRFADWSLVTRDPLPARTEIAIIGSGYGGAVTAARLAAAGAKVIVLERGQEWLPGDFPEDLGALLGSSRAVDPAGLFDLYMPADSDLDLVTASGVGGTSLINAAIATRPERVVLDQPEWPEALRGDALDPFYARAVAALHPNQYAGNTPLKVDTLRRMADARGGRTDYLPLNVRYDRCTLCGNCTTGCNLGAKNTLQTNYLAHARASGARIFAGVEVDRVESYRGRWRVHAAGKTIDADHVIVAGGSLGSTEILMRSAAAGLRVSEQLGTRVSANGDMLGLCYDGDQPTNLIGEHSAQATGSVGNALMGYVDFRGEHARGPELQDRFLLLESTIPVSVANTVAKALAAYAATLGDQLSDDQHARARKDLEDANAPHPEGALAYSTLYLACGHDDANGRYIYRPGGRPQIKWDHVSASRFHTTITAEMQAFTQLRSGHYIANPRTTLFGGRLIVPHPLGGCPLGHDARTGVVDDLGGVFDGGGGTHRGLHVLDGSIIPRSLAATPLLTICALAERASDALRSRS